MLFDFFKDDDNAISVLKKDHNQLKQLFDDFEVAESRPQRAKIAKQALEILKLHAAMEEEIFYPAARACTESFHVDEADEEHHVAKILVAELDSMQPTDDHFDAKFKVLSEAVRHHIKEEEDTIFPDIKSADMDLTAMGESMLSLRRKLLRDGMPKTPEERMVATETRKSPTNSRAKVAKPAARAKKVAHKKTASHKATSHAGKSSHGHTEVHP